MEQTGKAYSQQLIADLTSGQVDVRMHAFRELYLDPSLRKKVQAMILKQGENIEFMEMYQFALETFDRQVRQGRFLGESHPHTYILGIVKWKIFNDRKKQNRIVSYQAEVHSSDDPVPSVEVEFIREERRKVIHQIIVQLGERCRKLLPRWAQNSSLEELCAEFGFSSPEMAKKETYRCREKLKQFVRENPALAEKLNAHHD